MVSILSNFIYRHATLSRQRKQTFHLYFSPKLFSVKEVTRVALPAFFPPPSDMNGEAHPNLIYTDEKGNHFNVVIQPDKVIGKGIRHFFISTVFTY